MKRCHYLAIATALATIYAGPVPDVRADFGSNSCVLVGGLRAPALLEVYNESPSGGNGSLIWAGRIGRDQTQTIHSIDGRIRYNYRYEPTDPWNANVGAWCRSGNRVTVP